MGNLQKMAKSKTASARYVMMVTVKTPTQSSSAMVVTWLFTKSATVFLSSRKANGSVENVSLLAELYPSVRSTCGLPKRKADQLTDVRFLSEHRWCVQVDIGIEVGSSDMRNLDT